MISTAWLEIRDGGNASSPLLYERLCGSTPPIPIISSGSKLFVRLRSPFDGGKIEYKAKVDEGGIKKMNMKL